MGPSGRCWEVNPNPLGYLRRIFAETPANDCSGKIETGAGGGLCWWFMLVHFGAKLVRECLINISTYFSGVTYLEKGEEAGERWWPGGNGLLVICIRFCHTWYSHSGVNRCSWSSLIAPANGVDSLPLFGSADATANRGFVQLSDCEVLIHSNIAPYLSSENLLVWLVASIMGLSFQGFFFVYNILLTGRHLST